MYRGRVNRRKGQPRRATPTDRPVRGPGATADPGAAAAEDRVQALLDRMTRIELQVVVVEPPDAERLAARDRARSAAIVAGRHGLLVEATAAARELTLRAYSRSGFSGTWAATDMAVSVVKSSDRVAAAAAFEEAMIAAVVEDLVDEGTLEVLRSTVDELVRLTGIPSPGSLSVFASPVADTVRGPLQVIIVAGFVIVCAAIGLIFGLPAALVVLGIGVAVVAGSARRRGQPRRDPPLLPGDETTSHVVVEAAVRRRGTCRCRRLADPRSRSPGRRPPRRARSGAAASQADSSTSIIASAAPSATSA